jgi:hypothetical protein
MSMDLTGLVFGKAWTFRQLCIVYAIFGLLMLLIAYWLEGKRDLDFSFWGYLFGLLAFTGGLSLMESHSEWSKFGYLLIHIALLGISLLLKRKVFVVFGVIGIFGYLSNGSIHTFPQLRCFPIRSERDWNCLDLPGDAVQAQRNRVTGESGDLAGTARRGMIRVA